MDGSKEKGRYEFDWQWAGGGLYVYILVSVCILYIYYTYIIRMVAKGRLRRDDRRLAPHTSRRRRLRESFLYILRYLFYY